MSKRIEILLVEDNECDAELAIRALKKQQLANGIFHVKDGQEALEFLFGTGAYAERDLKDQPKVVLLDAKIPCIRFAFRLRRDELATAARRAVPKCGRTTSLLSRKRTIEYYETITLRNLRGNVTLWRRRLYDRRRARRLPQHGDSSIP